MKQSPLSAAMLGLFLGVSACTPTAVRVQPEAQTEGTQAEGTQPEGIQEPPATKIPVTEQKIEKKRPSKAAIPDNPDAQDASTSTELAESWDDDLCSDMVTQQEMNSCARDSYEQADAQLNLVYQTLKGDLTDSGQQALQSAELAWIEFRDRDCTFAKNQFAGGSIVPLIYNSCLESHTKARIAELQQPLLPQISYQAADTQLNDAYQDLLAVLSAPETEDMTDIQLARNEYRARNCNYEILYGADGIEESQCLARMSEARTAQMENELDQRSL